MELMFYDFLDEGLFARIALYLVTIFWSEKCYSLIKMPIVIVGSVDGVHRLGSKKQ